MKFKLILQPDQFTSFTSYYLEYFWKRFFDIETYDPAKTYPPKSTLFVFWWMNANDELPNRLRDSGHKVAIDQLWEYPEGKKDFYWIEHIDWVRLHESIWWQAMGHDRYVPKKSAALKLALMPIRRTDPDRYYFISHLHNVLEQMIWSYGDRTLPMDGDTTHGEYQRFVNPAWYDDTFCSVVVETHTNTDKVYVTEKSFKPVAFYHPFMVLAAPGHLTKLKKQGFETFDNLFDESYDNEIEFVKRCKILSKNLQDLELGSYDYHTQEKIRHNHNHYYDRTLVETIMKQEIVDPLLAYAEA